MPALFFGHGSPMNAIQDNEFVHAWRQLGQKLPRPEAILSVSAHWETRGTCVTAMVKPPTIHDFGGFPRELYEIQYPAPGSPALARDIITGITMDTVLPDERWGLDHGTWSILRHMYPEADIPVVQMSLDYNKSPRQHYEMAKQLAFLRDKGVLIMASGNIVHNLQKVAWDKGDEEEFGFDWALEANEKVKEVILSDDHSPLFDTVALGKAVQMAIPTDDHFLPLLYVLALKTPADTVSFFNDKAVMGSLTMTSVRIG